MKTIRRCSLLAAVLWLGGCAAVQQSGDARVAHERQAYFPWEFGKLPGTSVTLPAVSLARAGTTEFHVGPLPPGTYLYALALAGGPLYRGAPMVGRPRLTRIAVSIMDANGKLLFQKEHALGEINVGRGGGTTFSDGFFPPFRTFSGGFLPPFQKTTDDPLSHALNYRVRITVTQPAAAPKATARIIGFSYD